MVTLTKFVCGCFGLGSLALLAWTLLQTPLTDSLSGQQSVLLNAAGASLQTASARADFALHQAAIELPSDLRSLSDSSDHFLRSNATTARLQWESMANSLPAQLSSAEWVPKSRPYWVQGVAQEAGSEADTLARKIPVVSQTLAPIGDRIAYLCQSISGSA